jgi:20S proteasome subunit beta 7
VQRLLPVGAHTVIGAGGDMADFQYMQTVLDELIVDEYAAGDGHTLGPAEIHEYLAQVMYARRSKIDPLWNAILVGGVKDGKRYVPYIPTHSSILIYHLF